VSLQPRTHWKPGNPESHRHAAHDHGLIRGLRDRRGSLPHLLRPSGEGGSRAHHRSLFAPRRRFVLRAGRVRRSVSPGNPAAHGGPACGRGQDGLPAHCFLPRGLRWRTGRARRPLPGFEPDAQGDSPGSRGRRDPLDRGGVPAGPARAVLTPSNSLWAAVTS